MAKTKLIYKPVTLASGMVGGLVAGQVFKQVWKRVDGETEAPEALQKEYGWRKILLASALQGAIYATVKAAVSRGGAKGVEKVTGTWPGEIAKAA